MSFQLNLPPSLVGRMAKEEGEEEVEMGKPKREDWKKLKELEEARKAGTAPAMKDEEGKDINPHIPQYIMQPPWYYGSVQPTLKHQRTQSNEDSDERRFQRWFKKGVKEGPVATKFRKGACENCGAMTHKKKDCLERPRKIGAKFTGDDIAPDEHVNDELSFDYDGKRDRWNGYDTTEHSRIVEEYAKIDEAKRQLKANKLDSAARDSRETHEDEREAADSEDENDEDKYADHVDMPGQKFETKQRITVRNLRIREDMAKYLYNLDPNSAYYDPKTRSMRDNPFSNTGKDDAEVTFAGDNFVRWSGDAHKMATQQLFAWEAYEKGQEAHLQADPTKLELLNKEFKRKKHVYKDSQKQSILSRYGGQEHLDAPPKELLMAETENYVEYSRTGTVLKGQERAKIKSRYEEDVYLNNHTSVWGSYWKEGRWGYQCCHSLIKESYCTGSAGREAAGDSLSIMNTSPTHTPEATPSQEEAPPPTFKAPPPVLLTTPASDRLQGDAPPPEAGTSTQGQEEEEEEKGEAKQKSLMEQHLLKLMKEERKAKRREKKKQKKKEKKRRKKEEKKKKKKKKKRDSSSGSSSSSDSSSESEDEDAARERRIKEAMKKQEEHDKRIEKIMEVDERKRPYNIMYDFKEPTEEEMEAFRRKRLRTDDPMSQFM